MEETSRAISLFSPSLALLALRNTRDIENTKVTTLGGLDISEETIVIAERNAREYHPTERAEYVKGDARKMPFENKYFDAVFTHGSLHEWAKQEEVFNEIAKMLKPGGRYFISDFRHDMDPFTKCFMSFVTPRKRCGPVLLPQLTVPTLSAKPKPYPLKRNLTAGAQRRTL